MSKGLGHIQRTILSLIESDPDGAWTVGQIGEHAYRGINRVDKKHRVAVARALRKMTLPEMWEVRRLWSTGAECCLYNGCSLVSAAHLDWFAYGNHRRCSLAEFMERRTDFYTPVDGHYNTYARVMRAIRWRDGSEVDRVEIQIADIERRASLLGEEWVAKEIATLPELRAKLAELKATGKSRKCLQGSPGAPRETLNDPARPRPARRSTVESDQEACDVRAVR
jgi:hypothetical protein